MRKTVFKMLASKIKVGVSISTQYNTNYQYPIGKTVILIKIYNTVTPEPINTHSGQKQPHNFNDILKAKVKSGKYLMENCQSEHYL